MNKTIGRLLFPTVTLLASCALPQDSDDPSGGDAGAQGSPGGPPPMDPSPAFQAFMRQAVQPAPVPAGVSTLGYVPPPLHIVPEPTGVRAQIQQTFPSKYDLRTLGKVGPIRDQGACGSCWAFATYASAESQLLPGEADDFSEEHLNDWSGFDFAPCRGGNAAMSIAYMSRWAGPVAEADDPYTAGASKHIDQGKPAAKHLQSALTIPDRSGSLDNGAIESAVMTYGAVMTTMYMDSSAYNSSTNAYYYPSLSHYANHAVAIVGWDDSYPASRFATTPAGNGAFLIRNSWGAWWGDAGYFWVSYYDPYIGQDNTVFNVIAPTTDFAAEYQYDKYGPTSAFPLTGAVHYQANVYTATSDAPVAAVGFYSLAPNTTVDVTVWSNPVAGNPSSGAQIGELDGTVEPFAGYHTISLASVGAQTRAGQTFSVVLRLAASSATVPVEYPIKGYSSQVAARAETTFYGVEATDGLRWTDVGSVYHANIPVKVFVGPATSCDDGNPCTVDSGTPGNCQHAPAAKGTVCRAAADACDKAEVCDGKGSPCPSDGFAAKGAECRAAADLCDTAAKCTGTSAACPANGFKSASTLCRAAAGPCDVAEKCTGASAVCPADQVQTTGVACHQPVSSCDGTATCDGVAKTCPAARVQPKGTVCRASGGICDVAEACDGLKATCPANAFVAKGTQCRASAGVCDVAETCTGSSATCPSDTFKAKPTVCRPAAGPCDVAETCTGKTSACPADTLHAQGYVCEASTKSTCSGASIACASR